MDNGLLTLLILTTGIWVIRKVWAATEPAQAVIKETVESATLERCPSCNGVVGTLLKDSVAWRISQKNVCPHCGKKIKR